MWKRSLVSLCALALVAGACGGDDDDDDDGSGGDTATTLGVSGGDDENLTPTPGGSVTYALEADTTGGYCLAEAQLAISGIQVARALYDTLTAPDADGVIKPYLAESFSSNADATEWTFKLREGVTFHDGTALDSTVVKNNIDAWRGAYPARSPLLFTFVFGDFIKDVQAPDPLTVVITTNQPWSALPWFMWSSARLGIMGQAQVDSPDACNTNLIGTGPFKLKSWTAGEPLVAEKNVDYWQTDADGNKLPYLDEITFIGVESGPDRLTGLESGDYDMIHTSGALEIVDMRELRDNDEIALVESDKFGEVSYAMLNASKAPFDSLVARQAMAYAIDRDTYNEIRNEGILTNAAGPFAPGNVGYLDDAGYPAYDIAKATELVDQYKTETGGEFAFTITHSGDPETTKTAELVQQMAEAAGADVSLKTIGDQSALINEAIGGEFQAVLWRNHPGADPDLQYVWWSCSTPAPEPCDNLVNFGRFNDPEINDLLNRGRTSLDETERVGIYEDLNREFAEKLWNLWAQYTIWAIGSDPKIHGVLGPDLPDGSKPFPGLGTGHPVTGLWVEQ